MSDDDKRPRQMDGRPEFIGLGIPGILGLSPREICGRPVVSKLDDKPVTAVLRGTLDQPVPKTPMDHEIARREVCGAPIVSKYDGRPMGFNCNQTKFHLGKCSESLYP